MTPAEEQDLRDAVAILRDAAAAAVYAMDRARIWGGMDWVYNPLHPMHYRPAAVKLRDALDLTENLGS